MKRYFEVVGQKQTIELNIINGSQASTAPVEEISKAMKCGELKELTKSQYRRLSIQYAQ